MLSITTAMNGKVYEETTLPAEQILKMFNHPLNLDSKEVLFSLTKQHIKNDKANGMVRFAKVRSMTPVIKGTYMGNEVMIRYWKSKNVTQQGKTEYRPHKVRHEGREMVMKTEKDRELIAFLALSGHCKDTPIKTNSTVYFELTDKAKQAQMELQAENLIATLITTINNASERHLKQWAHSLELTGTGTDGQKYVKQSVRGVLSKTIDELKRDLVRLAKSLPKEFNQGIRDEDLLIKGLLREAQDNGIIYQSNRGGGVIDWVWKSDIEDGTVICSARPSQNAFVALYNHVLQPSNFNFITSTLNEALGYNDAKEAIDRLEPKQVETAINKEVPLKEKSNKELVKLGYAKEILYFDRVNMKVFIVKDGKVEKQTLHKVENAVAWQEELADAMDKTPVKRNRLLSNLK